MKTRNKTRNIKPKYSRSTERGEKKKKQEKRGKFPKKKERRNPTHVKCQEELAYIYNIPIAEILSNLFIYF
jgi:hypothetical protein